MKLILKTGIIIIKEKSLWLGKYYYYYYYYVLNIIQLHNFYFIRYLCSEKALKGEDDSCLKEKGETMSSDMKEKKIKKKENTKIQNKNKDIKEEL